jgi:hypothetical protein
VLHPAKNTAPEAEGGCAGLQAEIDTEPKEAVVEPLGQLEGTVEPNGQKVPNGHRQDRPLQENVLETTGGQYRPAGQVNTGTALKVTKFQENVCRERSVPFQAAARPYEKEVSGPLNTVETAPLRAMALMRNWDRREMSSVT